MKLLFRGNLKVFWMTMLVTFLMALLQHAGVHVPHVSLSTFLSPVPNSPDAMEKILPKLEQKANTFQLKQPFSLVTQTYATSDIDSASAYVAIDYDAGDIIAEKAPQTPLPIASLTKIMTAVVALDIASPQDQFSAPANIRSIPATYILITPGETLTLSELLQATLMTSANDAVEVIKSGINTKYHQKIFVKAMNEKAVFLGLKHTHFTNAQGFDNPENYSTAEDLAVLSHYALTNYPLIAAIAQKDYTELPASATHKMFKLNNWNGLLDVYPNVFGLKIGNTDAAGKTMIVGSERNGKKVLAVILGALGIIERDLWAAELLDKGFAKLANLAPISVTEGALRAKYATWNL